MRASVNSRFYTILTSAHSILTYSPLIRLLYKTRDNHQREAESKNYSNNAWWFYLHLCRSVRKLQVQVNFVPSRIKSLTLHCFKPCLFPHRSVHIVDRLPSRMSHSLTTLTRTSPIIFMIKLFALACPNGLTRAECA